MNYEKLKEEIKNKIEKPRIEANKPIKIEDKLKEFNKNILTAAIKIIFIIKRIKNKPKASI